MLINFRVENFLSFDQLTTFSMTLGKTKIHQSNIINTNEIDLLKFSGVYGANASGKTNIVAAIGLSQAIILDGIKNRQVVHAYNRNDESNAFKNTNFEYEIKVGNKLFSYGFGISMTESRIDKEWLYDVTDEEIMIYTRDKNIEFNKQYLNLSTTDQERLDIYGEDILENDTQLFLTEINKRKKALVSITDETVFNDIYNWFRYSLEVISPEDMVTDFGLSYPEGKYMKKLAEFLELNDTGIKEVVLESTQGKFKDIPIEVETKIKEQILNNFLKSKKDSKEKKIKERKYGALLRTPQNLYNIIFKDEELQINEFKFIHEHGKYDFSEESDGTIRLIELFSILFNKEEKVFVVDELDRSLHPLLTYNFVQSFLAKQDNSQLIVTTHEDRLLDLNLLRRDQIWFVEKDSDGNSRLYSLEEYKTRFDKNIMNAYLDGRYGGVPEVRDLFVDLLKDEEVS